MTVTEITSDEQFDQIIASSEPVAIDFWATWCGPCRVISPVFEKLSEGPEFEKIKFYKLDVDKLPASSEKVGIRAMPTFIIFKDGNKVDELVGANPSGLESLLVRSS